MASAPTLLGPSRVGCRYASAPTRLVHFVSGCGLNAKVDPCASLLALRLCDPCLLLGWVSLVASGVFGGEYAGVNTRAGSTDGFSLFRRLDATDAGSSTALRPSPYGMRSVSKRWLLSTNPKEMGSLYLLVALEAGVDGTLFSMRVRSELAVPFVSRVYNVLITAHAFLMIFFLTRNAISGAASPSDWA